MRRSTVQLLVIIGVPGLFAVAMCWGLGFYCECFGPALFMLAAFVLASVFPGRMRAMMLVAAFIGLTASLTLHVLATRTVIIENRSGQPVDWLRVGLPEGVFLGWNWPDRYTWKLSYETLVYRGVGVQGRLHDGSELVTDWASYPFGDSPRKLWIVICPDGRYRYATSEPPGPAAKSN